MYELSAYAPRSICLLGRSDQSPAFAGVRLFSAWSLRPTAFQAFDLRSNATTARLSRRSASAFPPPTARPFGRATSGGVGGVAMNRPTASAFGRVALVGFASLRSLGGVLSPLRSDHVEKENCKRLCLSQFFFQQNTTLSTNCTIFAL